MSGAESFYRKKLKARQRFRGDRAGLKDCTSAPKRFGYHMDLVLQGRRVLQLEAAEIHDLERRLDQNFSKAVDRLG